MKTTYLILCLSILWILSGCDRTSSSNPIPEFVEVTGATGELNDYDYKNSEATVDLKNLFNSTVYFRYAQNEESKIKSTDSTEITPSCSSQGSELNCSVIFPNPFNSPNQDKVFEAETVVYYQWFIDYQLSGGNDVATVEGPVRSFSIEQYELCVEDAQCSAGRLCKGIESGGGANISACVLPSCPTGANVQLCGGQG
ncbi:MAG: hypothetical protein R3208_15205 [Ketobacteraceae bacterium]|nr:hypothetical protein [Ketobacteraceae bacterium]